LTPRVGGGARAVTTPGLIAVPVRWTEPLMAPVPPLRPETVTEWPALPTIADAMLMLPLAAPDKSTPSPPALEMFAAVDVPTVAVVTAEPLIPSPLVPETLTPSTSTPFARPTPTPEAFVIVGALDPAATTVWPFPTRPFF